MRSYINGNAVNCTEADTKTWRYADGGELLRKDGEIQYRPCPKCGKLPTKKGHDACLGTLPGVKFACCGHGIKPGYILFENGVRLKFDNITEIKKMPK